MHVGDAVPRWVSLALQLKEVPVGGWMGREERERRGGREKGEGNERKVLGKEREGGERE